uniref:integrin alpha-X-like n=1 Tax=Styela clava TaxID=7725 RepID=UPI00193A20BC|nr:integrin alpha-X-like [Styela clava]
MKYVIFMEFFKFVASFNLQDLSTGVMLSNFKPDSQFGYDVALHKNSDGKTRLLVSVPRDDSPGSTSNLIGTTAGVLYSCTLREGVEGEMKLPGHCSLFHKDNNLENDRPILKYDFETTSLSQMADDDFDWEIKRGATGSDQTGPSHDHTIQKPDTGSYMLLECSNPRTGGETAVMSTPVLKPSNGACVRFWYHMRGESMGSLNFYIYTNMTGPRMIWSIDHDQGDMWHEGWVTVASFEPYQILIEGVVGQDYKSDIGLDDITLLNGNCIEDNNSLNRLFGMTLSTNEKTGQVLACEPMSNHLYRGQNHMLGMCYLFDETLSWSTVKMLSPCKEFMFSEGKMDLIFVIDGSDSVNVFDFKKLMRWLNNVVSALPIAKHLTQVAVVQYSSNPKTEFYLNQYYKLDDLKKAISKIKYMRGGTATGRAIKFVNEEMFQCVRGMRPDAKHVAVIITDGESQDDVVGPAEKAKAKGITMFAIGVGESVDEELKNISFNPDDQYMYSVDSYNDLISIQGQIQKKLFAFPNQGSTFTTQQCEAGLSAGFINDQPILGLPGLQNWSGGIAIYSKDANYMMKMSLLELFNISNNNSVEHDGQNFCVSQNEDIHSATDEFSGSGYFSEINTHLLENVTLNKYEEEEDIEQLVFDTSNKIISKSLSHSYLGYSISIGSYSFPGAHEIAVGAPRFLNRGSVFIINFQQIDNQTKIVEKFYGDQVGSYFGYSVCMTDMNSDGQDEVLIGAPLMMRKYEDMGQVVVYVSNRNQTTRSSRILLHGSSEKGARFGFAIAAANDLNQDGYYDVVIGAPSNYDGDGAIYIYNGGENLSELLKNPSQILKASTMITKLVYFGFSLHAKVDIDGNGHPDVAVGAPGSSKVLVILSKPVIHVTAKLIAIPKLINLSSPYGNGLCDTNSNGVPNFCTVIQICFMVTGKNIPKNIDLNYALSVDTYKFDGNCGIHFPKPQNKLIAETGSTTCINETLMLTEHILPDLASDIIIKMNYSMAYTSSNKSMSPMLNIYDENPVQTKVVFIKNCINKERFSNLKIGCFIEDSAILNHSIKSVSINDKRMINLHVNVTNIKDKAYEVKVEIKYNSSLYFSKMSFPQSTNCFVIEHNEDEHGRYIEHGHYNISNKTLFKTLRLKYINKIFHRAVMCLAKLQFGIVENSEFHGGLLKISAAVTSSSPELNYFDNKCNNSFYLNFPGHVSLESDYSDDQYISKNTVKNTSLSKMKEISFDNTYYLINQGYVTVPKSQIEILWPYNLPSIQGVLNLLNVRCIPLHKCQCGNQQLNSTIMNLRTNITSNFQGKWMKCNEDNIICNRQKCTVSSFKPEENIQINLHFRYSWGKTIKLKTWRTYITTELRYSSEESPFIDLEPEVLKREISTTLINNYNLSDDVPIWWPSQILFIGIGVAVGIVILTLLIIIFYKTGFFESKYKQKKEETMEWRDFDKYSNQAIDRIQHQTNCENEKENVRHKLSTFQ